MRTDRGGSLVAFPGLKNLPAARSLRALPDRPGSPPTHAGTLTHLAPRPEPGGRWLRLFQMSPARTVLGVGSLVILLMVAMTVAVAVRRHRVELTEAAREMRTLDLLLAEETGRSLQSVKLVLDSVAEGMAVEGVASAYDFVGRESTRAAHDALRTRVAGIPQLDAISLVGADGHLVNFSRTWPVPALDLSDRDYFRTLRDGGSDASFLSEPVLNRGTGTPTLYLARRLSAPDGTFLGLALGAIELGYFERFYASLHLDPGNIISLWRQDGTLLARFPPVTIGRRVSPAVITPPDPSFSDVPGVFETDWTMQGQPEPWLVASQTVATFPVQINLARSRAAILADWTREVVAISVAVGIAVLCLAVLMWVLVRRLHVYEDLARASRERERAVADREKAEDALRQAQKMEAVGQLTGGVAHDFNNLLTVVQSSVDLLRRPNLTDDRRSRYVEAIADAAERAAKLTAQLLAFARRQALKPAVFDAAGNISAVAQMVGRLTGSRVRLETKLPGAPCYVEADPNQFDTAVVNLAVNARDAMGEGGRLTLAVGLADGIPPLRAHAAVPGRFVTISVRDTGRGIAPDVVARVFEPFFTTKKLGEGTGLGLSQVLGFAKQSGGDVAVDSVPGEGTTFTLYLPRVAADRIPSKPDTVEPETVARGGQGLRVLVVEDNEQVGQSAMQMLLELGYEPTLADCAERALKELEAGADRFDLVFSDIVMPGLSGIELGQAIRRRHAGLPVLLTSGYSQALSERGSDGFSVLEKPYALDDLARALLDAVPKAA